MGDEASSAAVPFDAREFTARGRQLLKDGRDRLAKRFMEAGHAGQVLARQSDLVDGVLREAWRGLMPADAALVAVGGYGRGQMFPHSDVDLLILLPDGALATHQSAVEHFIGVLWDLGLEIGHSTRTVDECIEQGRIDITVQTNLLEARRLDGDVALFDRLRAAFIGALDPRAFCEAKLLEQQQRHTRFNDIAYSLEPNLKENPGGLRDLQVILWVARASGMGASWHDLTTHGILTPVEATRLTRHEAVLQGLRIRLHHLLGRREDRLLFDLQGRLAQQFDLVDSPARRASEQLMQRFYRTAKAVLQLSSIVLANLRSRLFPAPDATPVVLGERFRITNELLELAAPDLFDREPGAILETFLVWQRHPEIKGLAASTQRALWHARRHVNAAFRQEPANRELFMQMLREPAGLTHTLRRLNRFGLLGLYIPAFGRIVGRMQHDLFHVYTVDEHILMVVRNLRRFAITEMAHEYPLCSRLMTDFARPEVLYLAGLFHDIAKGRGGDHSALGRVDALRFARAHGLSRVDADLVAWLVEHHLTMSATAQKQDLSDPAVIQRFAELVADERHLVGLYLLTVADVRGTSPKVWNAWKGKLLEDLFRAARHAIGGTAVALEGSLNDVKERARVRLRAYAVPEEAEERLWSQLDDSYFLRHDPGDIAWHTRHLFFRADTRDAIVKARLSPIGEGMEVFVYVPDQPLLFARICSVFERLGYNIVEARVYTTRAGYALDHFLVMDPSGMQTNYRDVLSLVEHELTERLRAAAPLDPPSRGRVSRQLKAFPLTPEVTIRPDERGAFHYLSLIAGDRPGLLSRVTRTLAEYDIQVQNAKINTLGARAEDVFLLKGDALKNAKTVVRLEADLIHQLEG